MGWRKRRSPGRLVPSYAAPAFGDDVGNPHEHPRCEAEYADDQLSVMRQDYLAVFEELIRVPFQHVELVWGIVPLYFALLLSELTSAKKSFRTAVQTGFSFLWAGAQWVYLYRSAALRTTSAGALDGLRPINLLVTGLVLVLGAVALYSGLRRRFPKYASFLGHTRFSNYFMITLYPIQTHALEWTWRRLAAIVIFAVPVWLVLHFGLMPFRGKK